MRKREQVSQWWEWEARNGARATSSDRAWIHEQRRAYGGKVYRVTRYRVTRYRLAPLVEVSGWKKDGLLARERCGSAKTGAVVGLGSSWFVVRHDDMEIHGKGGRPEAEAALALLGYRVRK